jgi:hypothetical protein
MYVAAYRDGRTPTQQHAVGGAAGGARTRCYSVSSESHARENNRTHASIELVRTRARDAGMLLWYKKPP